MRMKMLMATLVMAGMMGAQTQVQAQMGDAKMPAMAAGSMGDPGKELDGMLTQFEKEIMGAAKAMPADKYDFSPASLKTAGAKFDGVRTFADQVKHVAQANYYFANGFSGLKLEVDLRGIMALKTRDEIVAALAGSFAFEHKAMATLNAKNAWESIKPIDGIQTRATLAAFSVAHGFDHYGQMVEYLRMNGIVPPASAK